MINKFAARFVAFVLLALLTGAASAVTCTSVKTNQTDWNKSNAWDAACGGQPPVGATVIIAAGTNILADKDTFNVMDITVQAGGILAIQSGNTISLSGNFTNSGTFTAPAGSTVALTGTNQTITGNVTFANLTLSAGTLLTLTGNIVVTGTLTNPTPTNLVSTCPTNYTIKNTAGTVLGQTCTIPLVSSINTASTNPATQAGAVSWTVVFSTSVSGVTAANFSLIQGGNVTGATITSVAGSGTTWTVNANAGSGLGTLGLNMVNVTNITPAPTTTMPFVGQVFSIYPALTCISDSFTGADNSLLNSINWTAQKLSGTFTPVIFGNRLRITDITGNVATRATNKNIFPFGNNMVVAEFDYWAYGGTGADGIAITFSDPNLGGTRANDPPSVGGFGGSLGYANRDTAGACNVAGFTGGWLGLGIDEYGNYSNPNECRNGGPGLLVNSVAIRGSGSGVTSPSTSNYAYLTGTAALGAAGVSSGVTATAYRYRITLDSITDLAKVMVKVEQDKTGLGTGYTTLFSYDLKPNITAGIQAPLPSELQFTFTGSTGGSTNYHEVDNLSICAASVVSALNHVAISAPTTSMTTNAVPVTITAHDAAHAAMLNAGTISLSTSTGQGDWTKVSGTGTLTPGAANSGLATYTFGAGESSANLSFTYQTAGAVTLNVANATGGDLLLNTPVAEKANTITFTAPSYVFTDSACVHNIAFGGAGQTCAKLNWSSQVAGQVFSPIYITALSATGVPTRLHSTQVRTASMQYGLTCHDPVANAGKVPTFTATTNVFPVCQGAGAAPATWTTAANISFPGGSPSSGPFSFNYPDVGKVELWMQKAGTSSLGSSGAFVVKPGGFLLSAIKRTSDNFVNPAAANANGTKFVKAGESFSMTVTATTCAPASVTCTVAGVATPNYGKETVAESVKLTPANVIAGMVAAPAVAGSFGAFNAGSASGTAFSWSEVGIIKLTPSVGDASYLGMGDVAGTASGNVGRFYPDHLDTEVLLVGGVPMACATGSCPATYNGTVYSGQPFSAKVTARNSSGSATLNYNTTTGFSKATTLTVLGALGATTPAAGAGTLGVLSVTAFGATGSVTEAAEKYTFTTIPTTPTSIYIRAIDSDGASSLRTTNPTTTSVEGGVEVVSGRIKISNGYGSELLPLTLNATSQYYNATGGWSASLTDSATGLAFPASFAVGTGGGTTAVTLSPLSGILSAGNLGVKLGKPGTAGKATVTPSTVPAYLQIIPGTATFGVYQKRKEFIYLRESY